MVLYIGGQFLLQYKISHLGLMVFVSPTAWRFQKRHANELSLRGLDDLWPIFVDWRLRVQNQDDSPMI
jgi:hypothetical protein